MNGTDVLTVFQVLDDAAAFLTSLGFAWDDFELAASGHLPNDSIPADAELMLRFMFEAGGLIVRLGIVLEKDLDAMRLLAVGRVLDFNPDVLGRVAALAFRWRGTICVHAHDFSLSR